jgi:hypothetical protein
MTGEPDTRDSLIRKALRGDISPDDAEAEAKRLGLGPLARKPNESDFDPMIEPSWTLPMAVYWIVWRRPRQVLLCWDKYRLKCWAWRRVLGRFRLVQDSPATLRLLLRAERSAEAEVKARKTKIVKSVMSVRSARAELWRALEDGTLQATGINFDTGRRVPIPYFEWHDLGNVEERGRDIVRVRNATPRSLTRNPNRGTDAQILRRRDGVGANKPPPAHEYSEVVVKRTEIMKIWPSRETTPTGAPAVERTLKPTDQRKRVARESREQAPPRVDDPARVTNKHPPGCIPLPQTEPRGKEPVRAYRALLRKFPDKVVPDISVERLAENLIPTLREMDKGGPVSREAVLRALGRKK